MSGSAAVARFVGAAARRDGRTWPARLRGFLGLLLALVLVGQIGATGEQREGASTRVVAVPSVDGTKGDVEDPDVTDPTGGVALPGLRLVVVDDPARAVADGDVDAALLPPPGEPADALADLLRPRPDLGEPALRALADEDRDASVDAQQRLRLALAERLAPSGAPAAVEVLPAEREARDLPAARLLAYGIGFVAAGALAVATAGLSGAASARALEPLRSLPVPRTTIAIGTALGLTPWTLVALGVGGTLLLALAGSPAPELGLAPDVLVDLVPGLLLGCLALLPVVVGIGAFAACRAGRERSVADLLVSLPLVLAPLLVSAGFPDPPALYRFLPITSAADVVGRATIGRLDPVGVALALASGLAAGVALVAAATRSLATDAASRR